MIETREVVVEGTPRSLQASARGLQAWRREIIDTITREAPDGESIQFVDVAVQILHVCPTWGPTDGDLDNIAKPILDALCGSHRILFNDNQVKELLLRRIEWKRRDITRIDRASPRLAECLDRAIQGEGPEEFVYVWVTSALSLERLP
jgi:Holliday junction resolvase RusA-like endonuclease